VNAESTASSEPEAVLPVYAVTCSSGGCLVGRSTGPVGSLITLHDPLQYVEVMNDKGEIAVNVHMPWRSGLMCQKMQVRWESVCGPNDMPKESQQGLARLLDNAWMRFRMKASGLADPSEAPPPELISKMQERIKSRGR